jgi:acyl-CoA oxidase
LLLMLLLQICAVFAQLTVAGVWQGPHVFMVRIRDDKGAIMPGAAVNLYQDK